MARKRVRRVGSEGGFVTKYLSTFVPWSVVKRCANNQYCVSMWSREKIDVISCQRGRAKFAILSRNPYIFSRGGRFPQIHFRTSRGLYSLCTKYCK